MNAPLDGATCSRTTSRPACALRRPRVALGQTFCVGGAKRGGAVGATRRVRRAASRSRSGARGGEVVRESECESGRWREGKWRGAASAALRAHPARLTLVSRVRGVAWSQCSALHHARRGARVDAATETWAGDAGARRTRAVDECEVHARPVRIVIVVVFFRKASETRWARVPHADVLGWPPSTSGILPFARGRDVVPGSESRGARQGLGVARLVDTLFGET